MHHISLRWQGVRKNGDPYSRGGTILIAVILALEIF